MPDRFLKSAIANDHISSDSSEEILRELERVDLCLPVATEVSSVPAESRIVVYNEPRSAGADRFRSVQINLKNLQALKKIKTLLITSPLPGEGKSTVALNLATALSENGTRPVLLLEADVYRPTLIKKLGLKPWAGLTECYKRGTDPMRAIRRIDPLGFYLLPAGQPVDDGCSDLLQSGFATRLIGGLASNAFSWILVDSPPTIPTAEILILKAHSDGTLLVARAGQTPRQAIEESARNLGRDHIVGIVLNGVEGLDRTYSKYYGDGKSKPGSHYRTPSKAAANLQASPPALAQATAVKAVALNRPAVERPRVTARQLRKTAAALLRRGAASTEIAGPPAGTTPAASVPLRAPAGGEAVFPAQPETPLSSVLIGVIAVLLLAFGTLAGWRLFHRKAYTAPFQKAAAQQVHRPAPLPEIAAPTLPSVNTASQDSELPEEEPQEPAPVRKSRLRKASTLAKPAPAAPATDRKTGELVGLQNLALEACAKGNYAEPREASAIAYARQALKLDPSNDYTRTILENSVKGGEYQVHLAIWSRDFTTAHRLTDALAELLPGESAVGDLNADLASAEKADDKSRLAMQPPSATLSFRVHHMHSGSAAGGKGSFCQGTLRVIAGRLKYAGESAPDGQVHSFDVACSGVVEVKKNSRVAFWEKGFHVRTASSNINFIQEDASASNIRALGSACSK